MTPPLRTVTTIDQPPDLYLRQIGNVFARFDTQDSGNISYGVQVDGERYFVKSAGLPDDMQPYLNHAQRVALLWNAVQLAQTIVHPALCPLYHVIESPHGPLLVYAWIEGELIGVPREQRDDPASTYQRFRALPAAEIMGALDVIFDLHAYLAAAGWIAVDFYDGCLLYDFRHQTLRIIDLDTYHQGPFVNEMGRMFGASRFMAPEEFQLGATIDQRTNVFTLGRMIAVFLADGTLDRASFRGNDALYAVMCQACQVAPADRFALVADFYTAWCTACAKDSHQESSPKSSPKIIKAKSE